MRRIRFVAIMSLILGSGSAWGQFAVDRPNTTPPVVPPPVMKPPTPAPIPQPPAASPVLMPKLPQQAPASLPSFTQATTPTASVAPAPPAGPPPSAHPWYVKPEHGQFMIIVKSYSGEQARSMAERLATEIRETYRVPAYLFEKGTEEKRKEDERVRQEIVRKKAAEEKAFLDFNNQMRAESEAKGIDFVESAPRYRIPKIRYEEQYAVLIGGWKDMDAARRDLEKIRQWQPPKDATLLDRNVVLGNKGTDGRRTGQVAFVNPFQTAFVTRNPVARRIADAESGNDPLVMKMNEGEELSVLKNTKPWTIVVKAFYVPVGVQDKDAARPVFSRLFNPKQDNLSATAQQARALAETLRKMPKPYDAKVLHTLNGSLVCVGEFDSASDPKLLQMQQQLETQVFDVGWMASRVKLFDQLMAMQIR